jgi:hypothetical protein
MPRMAGSRVNIGHVSAIVGILASIGGLAGFFFSPDTQRCVGLRGLYRGHPLRALTHCTDTTTTPSHPMVAADPGADPRQIAGTRWFFGDGDAKTYVTFNADGTVTFSDPQYGSDGVWALAGTRGVAFHTDAYEFGGTIGRGVPDTFDVSYRPLPHGNAPDPERVTTFTRVAPSG